MSRSDVHVYWNRTARVWSIRRAGRVVDRRASLILGACRFHAGESARQRVVRSGDRDVHAWVAGILTDAPRPPSAVRVGYRPSEPGFRRRDTGEIITAAVGVAFEADGSAWAWWIS
ncbi:hypothetical protein [Methylobacterium sp. WCS2018Hpa-22]|uniref:hypothetical protein n=1 Tax=Methylobacterium sp. WCS2018Hpa-22 TaxID=3073633 RepID=UPI00288C2B6F|nr:hypothetical protein [Methylobacterium sp. WCS2018Hpa-22]